MPEDDQERAIANRGFKPVDPTLLKFGATVLGKICRVAANLRFARLGTVGNRHSTVTAGFLPARPPSEYTGQSQQV
jgi:hypothetical protein